MHEKLTTLDLTFADLQQDLAFCFGKTLDEAANIITQAWADNELETLIYEME